MNMEDGLRTDNLLAVSGGGGEEKLNTMAFVNFFVNLFTSRAIIFHFEGREGVQSKMFVIMGGGS